MLADRTSQKGLVNMTSQQDYPIGIAKRISQQDYQTESDKTSQYD